MYIKSSELRNIDGKNYLEVYMNKEYPFPCKHNGEDSACYQLLFEEPNMKDLGRLSKISDALEVLFAYRFDKSVRIANLYTKESIESLSERLDQSEEEGEAEVEQNVEVDRKDKIRSSLNGIFSYTTDLFYPEDKREYSHIMGIITSILDEKFYREVSDILIKDTTEGFYSKYKLQGYFYIRRELIIEYIAFFFDHFISLSLIAEINSQNQSSN